MLQKQNKAKSSKLTNKEKIKQNKQQQQKTPVNLVLSLYLSMYRLKSN